MCNMFLLFCFSWHRQSCKMDPPFHMHAKDYFAVHSQQLHLLYGLYSYVTWTVQTFVPEYMESSGIGCKPAAEATFTISPLPLQQKHKNNEIYIA